MWTGGSVGVGLAVVVTVAGCAGGENTESGFGVTTPPATSGDATTEPAQTATAGSSSGDDTTGSDGSESGGVPGSSTGEALDTTDGSSTGVQVACGNGVLDAFEDCDDGNQLDDDACRNTCVKAACGDGVVQAGVEACDDGNQVDEDACLNLCVAATCGDAVVQAGLELCDDGPQNGMYGHCAGDCSEAGPACGDGVVDAVGGETCDDGNVLDGDGCSATCQGPACGNPGGGALVAENGTGMNKLYCYDAADSIDARARKACESHFGVGGCCVIPGGYSMLQWGQCGFGGEVGTVHFHPDPHPGGGHCAPMYVVGDVLSQGWCGAVLGNFLD